MRLKRGQKNYKLPKDFVMLQHAFLKRGGIYYTLCQISPTESKGLSALPGMPSYIIIETNHRRMITFYPTPDKAYYCEFNYLTTKRM